MTYAERRGVVVVGLGSLGSMALRQLARRGADVLGIEQFGRVHTYGAYAGESRLFRVAAKEGEIFIPALLRARELWQELGDSYGQHPLLKVGALSVGPQGHPALESTLSAVRRYDLLHEVLDTAKLRARYPQFYVEDNDIGVLDTLGGALRSELAVVAATELALSHGASVRYDTTVTAIEARSDGVRVVTSDGEVLAERVVLTAGPWTTRLLPDLADIVKVATPGIGLGRPVQRMRQGTDRISRDIPARSLRGGTSPSGTHRAPPQQCCASTKQRPFPHRRLCCPAAQPVLRPPPTPTRPALHFPGSPVIGRHTPAAQSAGHRAGEGLPSSRRHPRCVPRPIRRGVPHGCASRLYTASMAFTVISAARLPPLPPSQAGPLTTLQTSRNAADHPVAPPYRAFDAGLRRRAFPPGTASLLPGLLAATRTGLPPASDDELTNTKIHHGVKSRCHLPLYWAHERPGLGSAVPCSAGRTKGAQCATMGLRHGSACADRSLTVIGRTIRWLVTVATAIGGFAFALWLGEAAFGLTLSGPIYRQADD